MAIIGSASVQIRAVDKFFERDVRAAVRKIKNVEIELKADVDLTKVNKKLRDLRYRMRNNVIQLNIDADTTTIERNFQQIVDTFDGRQVTLQGNANTAAAEAQLALASRRRESTISAKIDPETQKALQGLFYTLTGSIPVDKVRAAFLGLAANFEMVALKGASIIAVLNAVAAEAVALTGAAFTLGQDLIDIAGLAAAAPAGFFMLGTAVAATTISWNGFTDAITGKGKKGAEALAKLPKQAQDAAISLRGVGEQIAKPVKAAFWEEVGTSIQELTKATLPDLKAGLTETGKVMGSMTRTSFASIQKFVESNGLATMFNGSNKGLANMQKGIDPVITALGKLGVVGSKLLPQFGDWVGKLGQQFGDWIDKTSEATITTWITDAVSSLQMLASSAGSTIKIFQGITAAANEAGFGGLRAFSDGLANAAKVANSEPFKSQLTTIFKAAGDASDILGESVGNLLKTFGDASHVIGGFFRIGASTVGTFIDNIDSMIRNSGMLDGLYTMLADFQAALRTMEPGFVDLGDIIGNLGRIAGTVFTAMAPGFNQIMSTLDGVFAALTPGIEAVVPVFNAFVQSVLSLASGPIITVAQGVGDMLKAFAGLPGPLQTILIAFGAIILLRGKLAAVFGGIRQSITDLRAGMDGNVAGLSTGVGRMAGHFGRMRDGFAGVRHALSTIPFAAATSGLGGVTTSLGAATRAAGRGAGAGLRGALSGGAALMGGPWGIALAAGVAALSAFGAAQEESKARVEALSGTLDKQTGAITGATKEMLATNALDGATDGWDDFFRGFIMQSASTEESLGKLGISTKEYTDRLADPGGRQSYLDGMNEINHALNNHLPISDEMAAKIGTTKDALKGVNGNSFSHLNEKAQNAANELIRAEEKTKKLAEATGLTSATATIFQKNLETLGSSASSAGDKFTALKGNLELLNGGMQSITNAKKGLAQSLADTSTGLKQIATDSGGSLKGLYSIGTGFNFASQQGRDLHTQLEGATDSILRNGTAAMDQALKSGKSSAEANKIAITAMEPGIASLRKTMSDLGMKGPEIDAIIRSFGLMPDQITAAVSVTGAEEAARKVAMAKLAADSFSNGNYEATLAALPEGAKAAIAAATGSGTAFATGDYTAVLAAMDKVGIPKEKALAQLLSVSNGDYTAALKAMNLTDPQVKAANGSIAKVVGKTVGLSAVDGVTPVAQQAKKSIDALHDKSVALVSNIITRFRTEGAPPPTGTGTVLAPNKADGGIMKRGVETFAKGGFSQVSIKPFARGSEKHVAQIAKGKWPYRVWAEPETGGEAYIPLSKGKRPRSLKILQEVARQFGLSLFNGKGIASFANGGVSGGGSSSSSGSSSARVSSSSNVSSILLASISREIARGNGSLTVVGKNIVQGLVAGVNSQAGTATESAKALAHNLENTVKTELDIHSPSKTFLGLGRHIVTGLTIGIKTSTPAAVKQMATLANRLYVAARDVAKATGRSVQSSLNTLASHQKLNAGWKKMSAAKYSDAIINYYQKTGKTGNRTLADFVRAREDVNYRLGVANKRLSDLQKARSEVVSNVANSMRDEYKLGTSIIGNPQPYIPPMNFNDVKAYTSSTLARLRGFNTKLQNLKKRGVSATLINEVAQLGSAEGSSVADAILKGSAADIKALNGQVAAISTTAQQIGNSVGDGMYKAGIDAQAGLVRGLTADSKAATAAINGIADSLVRTLKKRLGIRSPSRVFAELGKFTGQGFVQGLEFMQPAVDSQVQALVNPKTNGAGSFGTTATSSTLTNSTPNAPIQVIVNPAQGMDEIAVGKAAVRELNWSLISQ